MNSQGNVREKSGNFVLNFLWQPCSGFCEWTTGEVGVFCELTTGEVGGFCELTTGELVASVN